MKFFQRFWRGEIALGKIFWNGLCIGILLSYPLGMMKHSGIKKLLILKICVHSTYLLIWSIGLWKSAQNYKGNIIWKILVQIYAVAIWLGFGALVLLVINKEIS